MQRKFLMAIAALGFLAACGPVDQTKPAADPTRIEQAAQKANQQQLIVAQPAPHLDVSMERKNLVKRLERLNTENMSGYIYLLTQQGQVVAFYPIAGKVTSLNSYLSGDTRNIDDDHCQHAFGDGYSCPGIQVESPDYDGAYGKNSDGIFFFTADTDAYVEWHGDYLFSDQPLKLTTPPIMVRNIADK